MKACVHILAAVIVVGLTGSLPAFADDNQIAAAIANDHRTDADRKRDAQSKPEVILALLDLETGDACPPPVANNPGVKAAVNKVTGRVLDVDGNPVNAVNGNPYLPL